MTFDNRSLIMKNIFYLFCIIIISTHDVACNFNVGSLTFIHYTLNYCINNVQSA